MKARWLILIGVGVALLFPRFEKQGYSYQEFLWTSEWMKREYPSYGFLFKSGHVEGALMWNRTRLGFPFGAATIDTRLSDGVVQGRVETGAMLLNLLVVGLPIINIAGIMFLRGKLKSNTNKPNKVAHTNLLPAQSRTFNDNFNP